MGRTGIRLNLEFLSHHRLRNSQAGSSSKNSTASHTQTYFSLRTATSIMFQSHANVLIRSELYVILEAVAEHVEMHHKIREQRDNWNILLLNSINMITLTASTMGGVADAASGVPLLAFTLSSGLLFSAAMGILVIMNKILPL